MGFTGTSQAFTGTWSDGGALVDLSAEVFTNSSGKPMFVGCNINIASSGAVTLEMSVDGGTTWKYVAQNTAGTNHQFSFVAPIGAKYRFRSGTALTNTPFHHRWT